MGKLALFVWFDMASQGDLLLLFDQLAFVVLLDLLSDSFLLCGLLIFIQLPDAFKVEELLVSFS